MVDAGSPALKENVLGLAVTVKLSAKTLTTGVARVSEPLTAFTVRRYLFIVVELRLMVVTSAPPAVSVNVDGL